MSKESNPSASADIQEAHHWPATHLHEFDFDSKELPHK